MAASIPSRKILVVDDNHDAADLISEFLALSGYQAIAAYDGDAALKCAATFTPDVVLLDLGMPGLDGYAVAQRMRAMRELEQTRLIALTAWSDAQARAKVVEAGFHQHLVKPASFDALLQAIG